MIDLARSLTGATTRDALGEVADRHDSIAGPAWLLPLALAHSEPIELAAGAAELAPRAHVPTDEVHTCVAYVELAATSSPPVVAAAGGLVGLRDGLDAIPAAWYRQLDLTDACLALAQLLQETRPPHTCAHIAG